MHLSELAVNFRIGVLEVMKLIAWEIALQNILNVGLLSRPWNIEQRLCLIYRLCQNCICEGSCRRKEIGRHSHPLGPPWFRGISIFEANRVCHRSASSANKVVNLFFQVKPVDQYGPVPFISVHVCRLGEQIPSCCSSGRPTQSGGWK